MEPEVIHEKIKKIPRQKNSNDVMFIINCLKNHFVFYNLSESELYVSISDYISLPVLGAISNLIGRTSSQRCSTVKLDLMNTFSSREILPLVTLFLKEDLWKLLLMINLSET